jgi:hypothetical protein
MFETFRRFYTTGRNMPSLSTSLIVSRLCRTAINVQPVKQLPRNVVFATWGSINIANLVTESTHSIKILFKSANSIIFLPTDQSPQRHVQNPGEGANEAAEQDYKTTRHGKNNPSWIQKEAQHDYSTGTGNKRHNHRIQ